MHLPEQIPKLFGVRGRSQDAGMLLNMMTSILRIPTWDDLNIIALRNSGKEKGLVKFKNLCWYHDPSTGKMHTQGVLTKLSEPRKIKITIFGLWLRPEEGGPFFTENVYNELRASDSTQKKVMVSILSMTHLNSTEKRTKDGKANTTNDR